MTLFQKYEFLLLRMGNCLGFLSEKMAYRYKT